MNSADIQYMGLIVLNAETDRRRHDCVMCHFASLDAVFLMINNGECWSDFLLSSSESQQALPGAPTRARWRLRGKPVWISSLLFYSSQSSPAFINYIYYDSGNVCLENSVLKK